jgi:hypothetical protein
MVCSRTDLTQAACIFRNARHCQACTAAGNTQSFARAVAFCRASAIYRVNDSGGVAPGSLFAYWRHWVHSFIRHQKVTVMESIFKLVPWLLSRAAMRLFGLAGALCRMAEMNKFARLLLVGTVVALVFAMAGHAQAQGQTEAKRLARAPYAATSGKAAAVDAGVALMASTSVVSYNSPSGLIASQGNLYWTSKTYSEFFPSVLSVWRASKDNVPGSEILLYQEVQEPTEDTYFGDIVYAKVDDGTYYGYFVATYYTTSGVTSQIKRVPLTGGQAVVIAQSPEGRARSLQLDYRNDDHSVFYLDWIDDGGVRSVPIEGGAVTTMFPSRSVSTILFNDCTGFIADGLQIMQMSTCSNPPPPPVHIVSTSARVTALGPWEWSNQFVWGQEDGNVYAARVILYPPRDPDSIEHIQGTTVGRSVTSVAWAGWDYDQDGKQIALFLSSSCAWPSRTACWIQQGSKYGGTITPIQNGNETGHLQADSPGPDGSPRSFYWSDLQGVMRYVR